MGHYALLSQVYKPVFSLCCSSDDRKIRVLFPTQEDTFTSTESRSTVDTTVSGPVDTGDIYFTGNASGMSRAINRIYLLSNVQKKFVACVRTQPQSFKA